MKSRKLKKIGIWVLMATIIVVAAGVGWRFFVGRRSAAAQSPREMAVKVQRGDLEVRVSGTGAVESGASEEVRTRMSGTITRFDMKDAQQVKAGQVLAQLEVQDLSLQIEKGKLDITIQERDLAKLRQEKTQDTVNAPNNGEITWEVKADDSVKEGQVIGSIQDRNRLETVGRFNSAQIGQIKPGQKAQVFIQDFLTSVPAQVVSVNSESRPGSSGSVLYEVKAVLENPGGLDAGMKGVLTVLAPEGELRSVEQESLSLPESVDVRAPIAGKITMKVDSGNQVSTGQALAEVNDPDGAGTLADDIATKELRLRQANLDQEDRQRQQTDRIQNSQVMAPIDGTLVLPKKPNGVGDDVNQGTVLATVVDYSRMQVVIQVDELDVVRVQPGQEVKLIADALPGKSISGQVASLSAQGTSQNGVATFDVTVTIQPVEGLKVGMTVNADIRVEYRQNTLLVPIEAVQQQGNRSYVMVRGTPGPDGRPGAAQPAPVKTGAFDTSRIEILEGLTEGQEILLQGASARASATTQQGRPGMPGGGLAPGGMGRTIYMQQGGQQGGQRGGQQGGGR